MGFDELNGELTIEEQQELSLKLNKLLNATYSQKGLKQVISTGFEILNNPFFVCDLYFSVLAYTGCEIDENKLRWKNVTQNVMSYNDLMRLKDFGAFDQVYTRREPVVHNYDFNRMRSIAMRLEIKGKIAGHFVIYEYFRPFTKVDYRFITHLAGAVCNELMKDSSYSHSVTDVFDSYIMSLLNGNLPADLSEKDGRMAYYDLKFKKNLYILTIQIDRSTKKKSSLYYLKERLSEIIYKSKMVVYNNYIVILVESNNQIIFTEYVQSKLEQFIADNYVYAGLSNVFHDMSSMKKHYYQSLAAIKLGQKYEHRYTIYKYEDYYLYNMLSFIEAHDESLFNCSPKLLELMEFDLKYKTNYTESLYTYISSGRDMSQSSIIMKIHRNSMNYRIKKIEELISINLKEPKVWFDLYLSFQILMYCGKYPF